MSKLKVLVVDDHKMIRDGIKSILQKEKSYEVIGEASNGVEALKIINNKEVDLVIMDIQMPNMDGLEATEYIRRDTRYDQMPIVAMSAHAMEGDREISLQNGMDDHITKPIDPSLLYTTLNYWLGQRGETNA